MAARAAAELSDAEAVRRLASAYGALRTELRRPPSAQLAGWADELAARDEADTALLGTGRRAPCYEALLWSGARHPADPLLVTALLTSGAGVSTARLGAALVCGDAVTAAARRVAPAGPAVADVRTLGCAVVAALVSPSGADSLGPVLDVAASLMLVTAAAGPPGAPRISLVRVGHAAAAGWLATRAVAAGVSGMPGAAEATLVAVSGSPLRTGELPPDAGGLLEAVS